MARKQGTTGRVPRVLAWSLFAASVAVAAAFMAIGPRVGEPNSRALAEALFMVVFPLVGALVASRHPRNAVGWIFIGVGFLHGLATLTGAYAKFGLFAEPGSLKVTETRALRPDPLPLAAESEWLSEWVWVPSLIGLVVFIPLLFPDGRPPTPRWRWVVWTAALGFALAFLFFGVASWPLRGLALLENVDTTSEMKWTIYPGAVGASLLGVATIASIASVVVRFRRSRGPERQQLKWFVFGAAILFPVIVSVQTPWPAPEWVFLLAVQGIPIAVGIAILRYRLYDIDLAINRSLVYAALTGLVVAVYVTVVAVLGRLFEPRSLGVELVATGLVAVLFHPLRERLQRGVNRLMYGERDDPYAVLSRLGRMLEAAIPPQEVLPRVTETVAQALRLPYVGIELDRNGRYEAAANRGEPVAEVLRLPLVYQGEKVGRLVVGPRGPGEAFSPADLRLLEDLAREAGAAAHAIRLTSDLQRSRERLVVAREEERRRLRRDLHDGLGPALAGVALQLESAHGLLRSDPEAVEALVAGLKEETQAAIAGVRRIVYDLRPPALDELGLVGALTEEGARFASDGRGPVVSIDAPKKLPPLPAAVEVAAYRIAVEGITNAARHSGARSCVVRLSVDNGLDVEIRDDGRGLPQDFRAGVGVSSMRERAAELGGTLTIEGAASWGTRILAHLPMEGP